jgi:hypothetical protein
MEEDDQEANPDVRVLPTNASRRSCGQLAGVSHRHPHDPISAWVVCAVVLCAPSCRSKSSPSWRRKRLRRGGGLYAKEPPESVRPSCRRSRLVGNCVVITVGAGQPRRCKAESSKFDGDGYVPPQIVVASTGTGDLTCCALPVRYRRLYLDASKHGASKGRVMTRWRSRCTSATPRPAIR